jgi:NADPH2:quinone reductase
VGLAAVQLAKAAGAFVIGSASTQEGRDMCKAAGCDETVDHSDPSHLDQVKVMSGGQGVNIIVEMLANVNLGVDLPALAIGGRVAIVGSR